jgi:glycosyltransferase involved in cell wall biosynthesis
MNIGFAYSKGDVIGYLNADDWLEEGALASVLSCFITDPFIDIVVGNLVLASGEDQVILNTSSAMADLLQFLSYKWPLNPACYFYRRRVQDGIGIFPIDEEYVMDYWFLLRAFRDFRRAKTDAILGYFRIHGENKSRVGGNVEQRLHKERQAFLSEPRSIWWLLLFRWLEVREFLRARSRRMMARLLSVFG